MPGIIRKPVSNHFSLPPRISRLGELAFNLGGSGIPTPRTSPGRSINSSGKKPITTRWHFYTRSSGAQLNAVTAGRNYLEAYDRLLTAFDEYMKAEKAWFKENHQNLKDKTAAYFSFEFGLHESLPVYAGGLGALATNWTNRANCVNLTWVTVPRNV